jgi:hypothetical protein
MGARLNKKPKRTRRPSAVLGELQAKKIVKSSLRDEKFEDRRAFNRAVEKQMRQLRRRPHAGESAEE